MNFRVALIFLVFGFIGLLLVMGALSLFRWLKNAYPQRFPWILAILCLIVVGAGIWTALEVREQPMFQTNDLITLQEPVVARTIPVDRNSRIATCIVDLSEHLGVVEVGSGTLAARVESNNTSSATYCPIGADVRIEIGWLHHFTVTHR
jgi:hypothetical protein